MFSDYRFKTCCHACTFEDMWLYVLAFVLTKVNIIGSMVKKNKNKKHKNKLKQKNKHMPNLFPVPSLMFKFLPKIMIFDSPCTAQTQRIVATFTAISTVPKMLGVFWIQYLKLEPMSGHMWGWFCCYLFGEYLVPSTKQRRCPGSNDSSLHCVWEMFDFFNLNVKSQLEVWNGWNSS